MKKREVLCDHEPALKLFQEDDGRVIIWIDVTPGHDHSGLCLGVGATHAAAYSEALESLALFSGELQIRLAALGQGAAPPPPPENTAIKRGVG